ncbi:MAG: hypothetical protein IE909_14285, partial [Campylobacterales bacterium]|nr:hypothetical protein [Campylobacterales bacterium]
MNNQNNYLKEIEILERKVQSLENSLSYRLGYVLLNAFKSRKNFLGLFPTLLSLKKESERRNNIKDESYKIKFYDSLPNFEFINVKKEKPLIAVINNKTATRLILQVSIDGRRARGNLDKALIMKVKFFDENNKQVSLQNLQGLSYSQKTGNYKYINVVPNRISNKEIVATIDIPSKVNKSIIEITTWQGLDIDIKNALIVQQEIIQDEIKEFLIDSTLNVDEEIQFSKQQPRKLSIKIPTRKRIKITSVFNAIQGKGEEKNAAIAIFSFKDIDDKEVNLKNINGLSYSEKFGWYKYISLEHGKIQEVEIAEFRPPETATQCTITFMTWKGLNITLKNAINVSEYSPWDVDGFDIPKLKASDSSLKIASICDAFTEFSLKFDLNLDRLSRNKWKEQLVENNYSLLLVESAWNGNDGDWKYLTNTE